MPTCPQCGDPGAPTVGWCLTCGERVDKAGAAGAPTISPLPVVAPVAGDTALTEASTDAVSFDDLELVDSSSRAPTLAPLPQRAPKPAAPRVVQPFTQPRGRGTPKRGEAPAPVMAPISQAVPLPELPTLPELPALPPIVDAHATLFLSARYEMSSLARDATPVMGVLVELTAAGRSLRANASGPVAHVILALDVSASMNVPSKYPVLEAAVSQFLDDLHADDTTPVLVSMVLFSKGADVLFQSVPAANLRADAVHAAIRKHPLCFGRYTDVAGALKLAGRIARDQCVAVRTLPVRIYLMTDGRPQDVALAVTVADRLSQIPCDLHALAFGGDADVRVLQDLFAGRRGGTVKSVRRETLGDAFERIAVVAKKVVATRCLVSCELAAGVVGGAAYRYRPARVRFPDPAFAAGKRFQADLGTIESDRTYSLLFELRPPETFDPVSVLGKVTVRIPGFGGAIEQTLDLTLPRSTNGSAAGDVDDSVRSARDILGALEDQDPAVALRALKLRRGIYEAERRDPGLLAILDRAIELITRTGSLEGLSIGEQATLRAHTCTAGSEPPNSAEPRRPRFRPDAGPNQSPPSSSKGTR